MDKIDLRYQRGKIYTVRCYDDDTLIYVGSTIQPLSARMATHRSNKTCSLYQYVNGNWDNWYIELYEEYPCNNKQILEKREGEIIRLIGNINKKIEGRTTKEYYEDNKKIINEKYKQYYEANKKKVIEKVNEYRNANKEQILEYKKQHYKNNKTKKIEYQKQYRIDNENKINEKAKEKVICDHCGCQVRKYGLKEHQHTKKCLKKQI